MCTAAPSPVPGKVLTFLGGLLMLGGAILLEGGSSLYRGRHAWLLPYKHTGSLVHY